MGAPSAVARSTAKIVNSSNESDVLVTRTASQLEVPVGSLQQISPTAGAAADSKPSRHLVEKSLTKPPDILEASSTRVFQRGIFQELRQLAQDVPSQSSILQQNPVKAIVGLIAFATAIAFIGYNFYMRWSRDRTDNHVPMYEEFCAEIDRGGHAKVTRQLDAKQDVENEEVVNFGIGYSKSSCDLASGLDMPLGDGEARGPTSGCSLTDAAEASAALRDSAEEIRASRSIESSQSMSRPEDETVGVMRSVSFRRHDSLISVGEDIVST